jgi:hypothetical protein
MSGNHPCQFNVGQAQVCFNVLHCTAPEHIALLQFLSAQAIGVTCPPNTRAALETTLRSAMLSFMLVIDGGLSLEVVMCSVDDKKW